MSTAQTDLTAPQPPSHRVHNSSDPLPTRSNALAQDTPGGASTTDYSGEAPELRDGDGASTTATAGEHNAFNEQRPLDTQPAPEGGVAREGNEGLPEGKAGAADKLVGKTEKVMGKLKKDPELHERGELREAGGKAATTGEARAPHD